MDDTADQFRELPPDLADTPVFKEACNRVRFSEIALDAHRLQPLRRQSTDEDPEHTRRSQSVLRKTSVRGRKVFHRRR